MAANTNSNGFCGASLSKLYFLTPKSLLLIIILAVLFGCKVTIILLFIAVTIANLPRSTECSPMIIKLPGAEALYDFSPMLIHLYSFHYKTIFSYNYI